MSSMSLHEIVLKNSLDELLVLSGWVEQLSGQVGLSARCAFRIDLVLAEVVTNIIENAYVDEQDHEITVRMQYEQKTATLQVTDDGIPFDPLQQPEVILPKSLEDATEGGLGIHLIRRYADNCAYQRQGDKNVLTLMIKDNE